MLEGTYRRLLLVLIGLFLAYSDVLHQKLERQLLSHLNRALDFIHGGDAMQLLDRRDIDGRSAAASPFFIGMHGRVQRVEANSGAAKPVTDFANMLLVIVVKVATRREQLNRFRSAGDELVQQSRMQP